MIVYKVNGNLKSEDYQTLYESLADMTDHGLVLLPKYIDMYVIDPLECKVEKVE